MCSFKFLALSVPTGCHVHKIVGITRCFQRGGDGKWESMPLRTLSNLVTVDWLYVTHEVSMVDPLNR